MELDARKMQILQAIIDDYILTATPVGSLKTWGILTSRIPPPDGFRPTKHTGFTSTPSCSVQS